jgi:hypothetical protein
MVGYQQQESEVLGQRNIEVQIEVLGVVNEQICQQQADTGLNTYIAID